VSLSGRIFAAKAFMRVYRQFKSENFSDLQIDISALYLIASPSTPELVRQEAMRRADGLSQGRSSRRYTCSACAGWPAAGAFHRAYPHASQQAFLEAHELAFAYFVGVFEVLRYDNLTRVVKRILWGSRRGETERFIAFRSHWGYRSEFCTPGEGHEKGGVEGENGFYRRNHLVSVPKVGTGMS
jgi:hypothetical protein